jgi:2-polyprenyl-3-methyl-5-hydroxy-6-metoxy-1,4-benzoquinol methylase
MSNTSSSPILISQNVQALISEIIQNSPLHRKFLEGAIANITKDDLKNLDLYIQFCNKNGLTTEYLSECYMTIVMDTLEEQIYFKKHKKYRNSSFDDVANHVYFDKEYMSKYMYGLAITGYFWPNHTAMYRFFQDTVPKDKGGQYLEIGPGHGSYMMQALNLCRYDDFTGIDISKTSIELTKSILEHFCPDQNGKYHLECMDFLDADLPYKKFDAIVMGEVLEHVERPEAFLKRIHEMANKDSYIFITTCVNAPAIDHIYLYNTVAEVEAMFKESGLSIVRPLILPYENKTLKECEDNFLSINVAYALTRLT